MAILKETELQQELKSQQSRPFYYFYGTEPYKIRDWIVKIHAAMGGQRVAREIFYGDELPIEDFLDSLQNFSLFSAERIILIRHADALPAKVWEKILPALERESAGAVVIFHGEDLDLRKKYAQFLSKPSTAGVLVRCDLVDERAYHQWAQDFARARRKKISYEISRELWEQLGPSLDELDQALEKICLLAGDTPQLTLDLVGAIIARTRPELVFSYTDAVHSGNRAQSLENLTRLLEQGEEPIAVVALLARQYRWLQEIQERRVAGQSLSEIQQSLKIFPKVWRTLTLSLQRQGPAKIQRGLEILRQFDLALKSSFEPPHLAIYRMTLDLTT